MRTPLLSSLRRLVSDLRIAKARGMSPAAVREAREERVQAGVSRRALLGGAAAAAAALSLPRRANANGATPSVAIIGAGMAGMACARILDNQGVDFKVYEASSRIGGRVFTNDSGYWSGGQISEWGGELIDTGHRRMRKLAERYGLLVDDLPTVQPNGSAEVYHVGGGYYPKTEADSDFAAMFDVVAEDEALAGYPTTWDDFTPHGQFLDQMSISDWIATRVPGGHDSPLGKVLDLAYAIEYGADTVDQSALNLLYLLAYQPDEAAFASFGESDERFHIQGGNQQLPKAIARHLPQGSIEKGHQLVKLKKTSTGRTRCTFEVDGCHIEKTFDWVIVCMPFAVLADVDFAEAGFDARKELAIRELGRGKSGKLQLQFQTRSWLGTGPWPGVSNGSTFSDTGYQASWEPTRGQPGTAGILNLFSGGSVTAAMRAPNAFGNAANHLVRLDAEAGLAQARVVYPGLIWNGKATQSIWHKAPFAKHGYAYYRVGQYTTFGGHEGVRQGGVLFAGDHTSQDFQGFMEGAVREGERAARELIELL